MDASFGDFPPGVLYRGACSAAFALRAPSRQHRPERRVQFHDKDHPP